MRKRARFVRLVGGLVVFGLSIALMVNAGLGLGPWDVLHQGLAERLGVKIGWVVVAVSALALLAWIPLRERPGAGTVLNLVLVGPVIDAASSLLPSPGGVGSRVAMLCTGIVLNGIGTGLYVGAHLGPGPRDGLMTAFAARGHTIRSVRWTIEVTVLAAGLAVGGSVGAGTKATSMPSGTPR